MLVLLVGFISCQKELIEEAFIPGDGPDKIFRTELKEGTNGTQLYCYYKFASKPEEGTAFMGTSVINNGQYVVFLIKSLNQLPENPDYYYCVIESQEKLGGSELKAQFITTRSNPYRGGQADPNMGKSIFYNPETKTINFRQ